MTADVQPLVVIAGKINPAGVAQLEREARVVLAPDLEPATVIEASREAEGILFRAGPRCDQAFLGACPRLRVVGRHGAGLDTVDLDAATRLGIAVVHAPGSNSQAVAEHTLMLMLACVKRTVQIDRMTRKGDWRARHEVGNTELAGKTLGIVGVGNIGRRVAWFAGAIGMRVLAYDKYVPAEEVHRRGAEHTGRDWTAARGSRRSRRVLLQPAKECGQSAGARRRSVPPAHRHRVGFRRQHLHQ